MNKVDQALRRRMEHRQAAGLMRSLSQPVGLIDFCSNDYLGLARSVDLQRAILDAISQQPSLLNGATGSRLLSGNSALAEELEVEIAAFHSAEAALLFNSGYDANVGLLASLPQRGDTLLTDELIHASMIDGARLSSANRHKFRHNDLDDLEAKLRRATGTVYVAVESIYSMDGDLAPLPDLVDLCDRYQAALIVDEAHATGVYGPAGEGLVSALGLQKRVFARVHTFGKALGVHGAAVVGSVVLREYLINFARSLMYTTALPPSSVVAIRCAYATVRTNPQRIRQLHMVVHYFLKKAALQFSSVSPIQWVLIPGNEACRNMAVMVQQAGFDLRPILSPTVPVGQERLRICLHAFNTFAEIDALCSILQG